MKKEGEVIFLSVKKIFKLLLLCLLVIQLSSCTSEESLLSRAEIFLSRAEGQLEYKSKYSLNISDYKVDFIDYDEIFLKEEEEQPKTGRYSDTTADGKLTWKSNNGNNPNEKYLPEENPIVEEMLEKLTIDGKKIKMPYTFKDLGEEYEVFDKIDFSKLTSSMFPFTIVDKTTGNKLTALRSYKDGQSLTLLKSDNSFVCDLNTNTLSNEFSYISTSTCSDFPQIDVRVDGIGIGNTLNEVYEKFGIPKSMIFFKTGALDVKYSYHNRKTGMGAVITFYSGIDRYDYRKKVRSKIKNNVIVGVNVYLQKEE